MDIFTRYGSQVRITRSYKNFADVGIMLVQAEVIQTGPNAPANLEETGQLVNQHDSFSRGWVPATHLLSDASQQELVDACLQAPGATPPNVGALLRLYWPQVFGPIQTSDVTQTKTVIAGVSGFARKVAGMASGNT